MGSSASTEDKPASPASNGQVKNSQAPSTSRNKGFQEVQLKSSEPAPSGSKTSQRKRDSGERKLKQRVDEVTEGKDMDFHNVVRTANNSKSRKQEMIPQYPPDQDLALETFYHNDGNVYTCLYQGGSRFYLNFHGSQDWEPFPEKWYNKGVIVTESIIQNETAEQLQGGSSSQSQQQSSNQRAASEDDREGIIMHPTRGKISTYIYEEKRNVHYFFDKESGQWVRLPIAWELHSELIQKLIAPIREALPAWKDQQDILAALRASNYDPHDCIAHYLAIGLKDELTAMRNPDDAKLLKEKENTIREQKEAIHKLKKENERLKRDAANDKEEKRALVAQVNELKEQVAELQAELSRTSAQLESMKQERPKTPAQNSKKSGEQVETETVKALSESAKQLHKDYSKLKIETKNGLDDVKTLMKQVTVSVLKLRHVDTDTSRELEEFKALYKREALQRKLLYNRLQEIQGNIRVFCRCRYDKRVKCCLAFPTDQDIQPPNGKKITFDKVFDPNSNQEQVYNEAKSIITSCVDGYNVCILAYGQTGSGKTHTMMGPPDDPGVNVRAIKELLGICQDRDHISYKMTASMVEIYNETIQDLLTRSVTQLEIRTQGNSIHLPGMTELPVETEEDINNIMELGQQNRTVAATKMNSTSSRSHLIFMIKVVGVDKQTGVTSTGTLTLCDLAGSERVSKTEAQGKRLVEAAAINKSLTSLGQVFSSLRQGALHVPYRNSKLTHILQPSLGGDAKACLFVAVSPDSDNLPETMSTLNFGSNARQVQLGEAKKNVKKGPPIPR